MILGGYGWGNKQQTKTDGKRGAGVLASVCLCVPYGYNTRSFRLDVCYAGNHLLLFGQRLACRCIMGDIVATFSLKIKELCGGTTTTTTCASL